MIAPLERIKRLFDPTVWAERSYRKFSGSGTLGGDPPAFDYAMAVQQYKSWAYIAANIVARECAQHPLRLYVRDGGRAKLYRTARPPVARRRYLSGLADVVPSRHVVRKSAEFGDDFVEVTEPHPAVTKLCDPNPWMGGFDMSVLRWVYLQLTGNAYLHPVSHVQLGTPDTVWVMPSQWVKVAPDKDRFIKGYTYGTDDSNLEFFEPEDVIHFKLPNPTSLYYGRGVLESMWSVWALHGHKRTMDLAHFENRARPDWIAALPGNDAAGIERFEAAVAGKLRGSRKAGKMLTVGNKDFSLHQLNFPPDVISDTDRVLDEIAGGFGVPRARITGNQSVAGGGSEQADATFLRGTVAPMLRSDEETLNNQWLPLFGLDPAEAFLAYDNPVPGDKVFERDTLKQQIDGGRITINDANAMDGLEPVEGGDVPRFNGVPLDEVGAMPAAPSFTFNAPDQPANTFVLPRSAETPPPPAPTKARGAPARAAVLDDTPLGKFMDRFHTKADADRDTRDGEPEGPGDRMERRIAEVLDEAGRGVEGQLAAGGSINYDALGRQINDGVQDATLEPITEAFTAGGTDGLSGLSDSPFDVTNPRVSEAIREFNLRLAGEVAETTVNAVKDTIAQGVDAGESVDQLRRRVEETGQFSRSRAEAIARTESARGYVTGKEEGWRESGVVSGKRWALAPNACPYCREAARVYNAGNGQELGETPFKVGDTITPAGMSPMTLNRFGVAGPPLHPNDRCDIEAVVEFE